MAQLTTTPDFQVNEYVLAQGSSDRGELYAHFPAKIQSVESEIQVVCEWVDPENKWHKPLERISTSNVKKWNFKNIDYVSRTEVPSPDKKYWRECTEYVNSILGKICLLWRKDRQDV